MSAIHTQRSGGGGGRERVWGGGRAVCGGVSTLAGCMSVLCACGGVGCGWGDSSACGCGKRAKAMSGDSSTVGWVIGPCVSVCAWCMWEYACESVYCDWCTRECACVCVRNCAIVVHGTAWVCDCGTSSACPIVVLGTGCVCLHGSRQKPKAMSGYSCKYSSTVGRVIGPYESVCASYMRERVLLVHG